MGPTGDASLKGGRWGRLVAEERSLPMLLAALSPQLRPGRYVFVSVTSPPDGVVPVVALQEDEGTTLVLEQHQADEFGLGYDYVAAMITLRVRSPLDAVGLTAAVATRLASAGLSCNVVAGYHHDHLFVPYDEGTTAIDALRDLASQAMRAGAPRQRALGCPGATGERNARPTSHGAGRDLDEAESALREGETMADEREELHELRQQGHEAGIEGSSKMTTEQLREALGKVGKGESPAEAKQEAKSDNPSR